MKTNPEWTATQTITEAQKQGYGGDDGEVHDHPAVIAAHEREANEWVDELITQADRDAETAREIARIKKAADHVVTHVVDTKAGLLLTPGEYAKRLSDKS
jgi:hypothetical protein